MRVASKTTYDMVKFSLGNIAEELKKANETVATAKRINSPSDDPVGLTQALKIRSDLSNIKQLGRNIEIGKSWLNSAESAVSKVQGLISNSQELCVQMASSTVGSSERASAAERVRSILEEMVSLANSQVGGRYIFAGSKTDTTPFGQDGSYNGNNEPFSIKIGRDATLEVGSDGGAVFGTVFNTLNDLKDALAGNDVGGIEDAMSELESHFEHITTKISDIGTKTNRMEIEEKIFQDLNITKTERLSMIEDADIAEAITELKEKEVAYQAALASSARVMSLSLVDYLK